MVVSIRVLSFVWLFDALFTFLAASLTPSSRCLAKAYDLPRDSAKQEKTRLKRKISLLKMFWCDRTLSKESRNPRFGKIALMWNRKSNGCACARRDSDDSILALGYFCCPFCCYILLCDLQHRRKHFYIVKS